MWNHHLQNIITATLAWPLSLRMKKGVPMETVPGRIGRKQIQSDISWSWLFPANYNQTWWNSWSSSKEAQEEGRHQGQHWWLGLTRTLCCRRTAIWKLSVHCFIHYEHWWCKCYTQTYLVCLARLSDDKWITVQYEETKAQHDCIWNLVFRA